MEKEAINYKKGFLSVFGLFFMLMINFYGVSASESSVSEIFKEKLEKVSNYAEEYESGNINYAQLMIYISSERQDMENLMGGTWSFSEEKAISMLGKPSRYNKEMYSKKDQKMVKSDSPIPVWEKIVFDGRKIRINLKVEPFMYYDEETEKDVLMNGFGLYMNFKSKATNIDLDSDSLIGELKNLAQNYADNPSEESAASLSKKSLEFEYAFRPYLENSENCEDVMEKIFGSSISKEKVLHQEFTIYSGSSLDIAVFIESCESCKENPWMWVDIHETNSYGNYDQKDEYDKLDSYSNDDFKREIENTLDKLGNAQNDDEALALMKSLNNLIKRWQESYGELIKREAKENAMKEGLSQEEVDDAIRAADKISLEERKSFLSSLFSSFEKKEYSYSRTIYEKKLVERYQKRETCDNNIDDNDDGKIDCSDNSCNGNKCSNGDGKEAYCISGSCKIKEYFVEDESIYQCQKFEYIPCLGQVIFKGKDVNGCPLEPICIEKKNTCSEDSDCSETLCGKSSCVDGFCKTLDLKECKDPECSSGDKKTVNCESGDGLVISLCLDGIWRDTGQKCSISESPKQEESTQECNSINDCSSDEVCSNGECVAIPEDNEESGEQEEITEKESAQESEASEESSSVTGNIIKAFKGITGFFISGFEVKEENNEQEDKKFDEEYKEQYTQEGAISLYGECRNSPDGRGGSIGVNGWGLFWDVSRMKEEYKNEEIKGKCKREYINLITQRRELEKSLNDDFAKWFFDEYLASSADEWNKKSSTIDELYWLDINLAEALALNKECADEDFEFNLINLSYSTSFGEIKFWEEAKEVNAEKIGGGWGFDGNKAEGKVKIISPRLGFWIFPSREFIKSQMNKAMENQRFGENYKNEEDETLIDKKAKENIKKNKKMMEAIENLIDKYGKEGKLKANIYFKDYTNDETVLGIYAELDSENILNAKPMFPQSMPEGDVKANIDFNKLLDMMESIQKDVKETEIRSPDWDRSFSPFSSIKKVELIISVFFKIRSLISSVESTPTEAKGDVINLVKTFAWEMAKGSGGSSNPDDLKAENDVKSDDKSASMTGNVIYIR